MVGRKNNGVGRVRGCPLLSFPQAPAVFICRTAEVTPEVVGIFAVGYHRHWHRLQPGVEGAEGDLCAGIV